MEPYQAPLRGCDDDDHRPIAQSYEVLLHPGHTLEEHKRAIGVAAAYLDILFKFPETHGQGIYYRCDRLDDNALAAVRADIGVDKVECVRNYAGEEDF